MATVRKCFLHRNLPLPQQKQKQKLVVCIFLLFLVQPSFATDPVPRHTFLSESCIVDLAEDVRWFYPEYDILIGNSSVNIVRGCEVTKTQRLPSMITSVLRSGDDMLVLCTSSGSLHAFNPVTLANITAEAASLSPMCESGAHVQVHLLLGDALITASSPTKQSSHATVTKLHISSGRSVSVRDTEMVGMVTPLAMFQHGPYLYSIFLDIRSRGVITRSCAGEEEGFNTLRYGTLSCTADAISHDRLLWVEYDSSSSSLLLLLSRDPLELSARLLCRLPLERVNGQLDSGFFLDYNELGEATRSPGIPSKCGDDSYPLSQLLDPIDSSEVLVRGVAEYTSFSSSSSTPSSSRSFYLLRDGGVDIYKDYAMVQSMNTGAIAGVIGLWDQQMFLLTNTTLILSPALICSHITDPVECYVGQICAWSRDTCYPANQARSFAEDYPEGVARETLAEGGCVRHITWYRESGITTDKQVLECEDLGPLALTLRLISLNATCLGEMVLKCAPGTSLVSGDLVRQCLPSGAWSGYQPTCRERECPTLYPAPGSLLSSTDRGVGSVVRVGCLDECQEPESRDPVVCEENGQWNISSLPACRSKTCPALSIPPNAVLLYPSSPVGPTSPCGGKVVVECLKGHSLVYGDKTRYCRPDGTWDGTMPFCAVTHCERLAVPPNSVLSSTSRVAVNTSVRITCNTCHQIARSDNRFQISETVDCLRSGEWSNDNVFCEEVKCPVLYPAHGVKMLHINPSCNGTAEFECEEGYQRRSGSMLRRCLSDGKWSGSEAKCQVVTCPFPELNAAESRVEMNWAGKVVVGERVSFRCAPDTYLLSGSLEIFCLPSGAWSGEVPECSLFSDREVPNNFSLSTVAPEYIKSPRAEDQEEEGGGGGGLVALAVIGWLLFVSTAFFVVVVLLLMRNKYTQQGPLVTTAFKAKGDTAQLFDRQLTQITTISA